SRQIAQRNLGCAVHILLFLCEVISKMSIMSFASRRGPLLLILMLAAISFAQSKKNPKKGAEPGQPVQHATPEQPTTAKPESTSGTPPSEDEEQDEQKGPWHGLRWRSIGPFRGGRVLAVSGVVGNPHTYYFGGVGGGVWKSTDDGLTWRPVTDKVKDMAASIGSIAVAASDSNVVYAATGEACIRGNIIPGNGVYKSIDAGKNWAFVGLKDTHAICRIIV